MAKVNWLADYRQYIDSTEAPRIMHLWTGISTLISAMRRNYYIPFGHIKMFPYFYIVLVGPAGVVQKSTTLGFSTKLLGEIKDIFTAPDATSPQKLIMCLEEAKRNITSGLSSEQHHCLTMASSEFASIISGPDYETMITWLTDLFDRESSFKYQTKTSGDCNIINPWIHLIACTTPSSLAQCLPVNAVGDGLTSRIIFVYASKKDQLVSVPRAPKADLVTKLVEALEVIGMQSKRYIFTDEALKWWHEFYTGDNDRWLPNDKRLIPYKARRHAHILKLSMVLACNYGEEELTVECLQKARKIIELTEINMPNAFGGLGENVNLSHMLAICEQLKEADDYISLHKLCALNYQMLDPGAMANLLRDMNTSGMLSCRVDGGDIMYKITSSALELIPMEKDTKLIGEAAWKIILED